MPDMSDITKTIVSEEERKRLIDEISKIQGVLDSFKYGLNFEQFADELFKTIDRLTLAMKKLDENMIDISVRMERLEQRFNEGIKVRVSALTEDSSVELSEEKEVLLGEPDVPDDDEAEVSEEAPSRVELEKEAAELEIKIARLFEKENDLEEMAMNDPAGADDYHEKADVARQMRKDLESRLKEVKEQLETL